VAHDPFNANVSKEKPFSFTVTLHVLFRHPQCFFFLSRMASFLAIATHLHLKLFPLWMRVKTLVMKKAKAAGFLPDSMEYAFPGDEVIPRPVEGFRVMFITLLYGGLSLPAHEFLCGLLFIYGMQ
jgi:hypothetical protein